MWFSTKSGKRGMRGDPGRHVDLRRGGEKNEARRETRFNGSGEQHSRARFEKDSCVHDWGTSHLAEFKIGKI